MKKIVFILVLLIAVLLQPSYSFSQTITPSITSATILPANNQVNALREEVGLLRSENYQSSIDQATRAGESANTLIAIVGVVATSFGVVFAIMTIFFGINFNSNKKEMADLLKEMNLLVKSAKLQSEQINKYAKAAQKISDQDLPKLVKDLEDNRKQRDKITSELKVKTGKELEKLQKTLELNTQRGVELEIQLARSKNQLNMLNSRAAVFNSSATIGTPGAYLSPSPSASSWGYPANIVGPSGDPSLYATGPSSYNPDLNTPLRSSFAGNLDDIGQEDYVPFNFQDTSPSKSRPKENRSPDSPVRKQKKSKE